MGFKGKHARPPKHAAMVIWRKQQDQWFRWSETMKKEYRNILDALIVALRINQTVKYIEAIPLIAILQHSQLDIPDYFNKMLKACVSLAKISCNRDDITGDPNQIYRKDNFVQQLENQLKEIEPILQALEVNTSVTTLDISDINIGDEGAKAVANLLRVNNIISIIYLNNSGISDEGAQYLLDSLEYNEALRVLNLDHNLINEILAKEIDQLLQERIITFDTTNANNQNDYISNKNSSINQIKINAGITSALKAISIADWRLASHHLDSTTTFLEPLVKFAPQLNNLAYVLLLLKVNALYQMGEKIPAVEIYLGKVGLIRYLEANPTPLPNFFTRIQNIFSELIKNYSWLNLDNNALPNNIFLNLKRAFINFRKQLWAAENDYFSNSLINNHDKTCVTYLEFLLAMNDVYFRSETSAISTQFDTAAGCKNSQGRILYLKDYGWKLLTTSQFPSNFCAKAFINETKKVVLIAFKGLSPTSHEDLTMCVQILTRQKFPYLALAEDFLNIVEQLLQEHHYVNYHWILTGHSMGGAIAEYHCFLRNIPTIAFDAPGVKEIIESEYVIPNPHTIPIIHIFSKPDRINHANGHLGRCLTLPKYHIKMYWSINSRMNPIDITIAAIWDKAKKLNVAPLLPIANKFFDVGKWLNEPWLLQLIANIRFEVQDGFNHLRTIFIDYFTIAPSPLLDVVLSWPADPEDNTLPNTSSSLHHIIPLNYFNNDMIAVLHTIKDIVACKDFPPNYQILHTLFSAVVITDKNGVYDEKGDYVLTKGISADEFRLAIWPYFSLLQHKPLQDYLKKCYTQIKSFNASLEKLSLDTTKEKQTNLPLISNKGSTTHQQVVELSTEITSLTSTLSRLSKQLDNLSPTVKTSEAQHVKESNKSNLISTSISQTPSVRANQIAQASKKWFSFFKETNQNSLYYATGMTAAVGTAAFLFTYLSRK